MGFTREAVKYDWEISSQLKVGGSILLHDTKYGIKDLEYEAMGR